MPILCTLYSLSTSEPILPFTFVPSTAISQPIVVPSSEPMVANLIPPSMSCMTIHN